MAIHHDKMAYGRLSSMQENADEDKLKKMAERLSRQHGQEQQEDNNTENKDGKNK